MGPGEAGHGDAVTISNRHLPFLAFGSPSRRTT
jgi:hypothetical protein